MSISEQEDLLEDICNDVLGYGPLEPLLNRDDIADIMVNGCTRTFIEVSGKIQLTNVRFRDTSHLSELAFQTWFYLTPVMYRPELLTSRGLGLLMHIVRHN